MTLFFQQFPLRPRLFQLLLVVAIKHENQPLIGFDILRFGAIDEKAHGRALDCRGLSSG